eukprot:g30257.t1
MNAIYKFTDNTNVVGQISNNNESKYRREIEGLVMWFNENNLSLKVGKTKELIIDSERKEENMPPSTPTELRLRCILAWYGSCSAQDHKKLQKVVCTAQTITGAHLPSMDSTYMTRCPQKGFQHQRPNPP